jgi:hypothetical protein
MAAGMTGEKGVRVTIDRTKEQPSRWQQEGQEKRYSKNEGKQISRPIIKMAAGRTGEEV